MTKNKNSLANLLTLSLATLVTFASTAQDSAGYEPKTKNIVGTLPIVKEYALTLYSPVSLNRQGLQELPSGITVTLTLTSTSRPEGVNEAEALSFVSISPATLTYTQLGEAKNLKVTVAVPAEAVAGDYTYGIQGVAPAGLGWGLSSSTLNLSFAAAFLHPTDDTPPIVTISRPAVGAAFTYSPSGASVELAFEAAEDGKAGSTITAVAANANGYALTTTATGLGTMEAFGSANPILGTIGAYTVTASAASAGGIGDAAVDVKVNYVTSWLPPLSLGKTAKGGSTVPVKFSARDAAGAFVRDQSVKVSVYEVSSAGDVLKLEGVYGDGSSAVRIDDVAGQYIINFPTAPGTHNYRVDVYFDGVVDNTPNQPVQQATLQFSVR
jgi:hypothetical protein